MSEQRQHVYNAHPVDRMPEGYEGVDVEMVCCHPETGHVVIFGRPFTAESNVELDAAHSCDEMGCGSVGSHVLMTCTISRPWSLSYHANPKDRRVFKT